MTNTQRGVTSFVLRMTQDLWRDGQGDPKVQWRGHIRHVQSDEEISFTDFADAVAFVQQHTAKVTLDSVSGGSKMEQEKALRESFKLWQQFASSYTDVMLEAMETSLRQSDAIRQQMDEAVQRSLKTWKAPAPAEQGEVLRALRDLQAQVQALSAKIEGLEKALKKTTKKEA